MARKRAAAENPADLIADALGTDPVDDVDDVDAELDEDLDEDLDVDLEEGIEDELAAEDEGESEEAIDEVAETSLEAAAAAELETDDFDDDVAVPGASLEDEVPLGILDDEDVDLGDDEDFDDDEDAIHEGEFICRSCFMVRRLSNLADADKQLCRDCA